MSLRSFIIDVAQHVGGNEPFNLDKYRQDPDVKWFFRAGFIQQYPVVYRTWGVYRKGQKRKGISTTKSRVALDELLKWDDEAAVTKHTNVVGYEPISFLKMAVQNNLIEDKEIEKYVKRVIFDNEYQQEVTLLTPVDLREEDVIAIQNEDGTVEWFPPETERGSYKEKTTTDSSEFKAWFKNSKVVNKAGDPKIVYHGTPAKFDAFSWQYVIGQLGFHVGTWSQAKNVGGRILRLYASIQNPLRLPDLGDWRGSEVVEAINKAAGTSIRRTAGDREIIMALSKAGYDGIVYSNKFEGEGDSYIAFSPTQLKSIDNKGAWDSKNPRIKERSLK